MSRDQNSADIIANAKHESARDLKPDWPSQLETYARGLKIEAPTGESHFYALIVPVPREKHSNARNRRRREAKLLDQAKEILVPGMSLVDFFALPEGKQFLHLVKVVPKGWRPVSFKEKQS